MGLLGFIIYWTGQGFVEDWTADTGNATATTGLAWAAGICASYRSCVDPSPAL